MNHLDDKDLDELFGSLKDFESDPDPALWSEISASLPKNSFLHWGKGHLNIYYAGFGALILGVAVFFLITPSSPTQSDTIKQPVLIHSDSVLQPEIINDSVTIETPAVRQSPSTVNHLEREGLLVPQTDSVAGVKPDTMALRILPDSTPKKITEKKIVKIIRRDTLRVRDSIGIKRRRWQK